VREQDILDLRPSEATARLLRYQLERARGYYDQAFALLPERDRYQQRTGLIMAAIYQTILKNIEADCNQVLARRVSLSPLHKLWLAWRTARREKSRHRAHHAAD
jgi:phytoene synthase